MSKSKLIAFKLRELAEIETVRCAALDDARNGPLGEKNEAWDRMYQSSVSKISSLRNRADYYEKAGSSNVEKLGAKAKNLSADERAELLAILNAD